MYNQSSHPAYTWSTDREGFVCHWLAAGPVLTDIEVPEGPGDPFLMEARLREAVALRKKHALPEALRADAPSRLGCPWRFAGGRDGAFVNLSDFYPRLCRVRFDLSTGLIAPRPMAIRAILWSCAAVDACLNGAYVGDIDVPVYKPMRRAELTLELREGLNTLYLACETLGVRDTRSVVGLQLVEGRDDVLVTLPDAVCAEAIGPALAFLEGVVLENDRLCFPCPAPSKTRYAWVGGFEPDYKKAVRPVSWHEIEGFEALSLEGDAPWITLEVETEYGPLRRRLERTERIVPLRLQPAPSFEENRRRILERVADVHSLNRGGQFGFAISNILARKALNRSTPKDEALLWDTLSLIEQRVDCADFLVCGLIRYLRIYPVGDARGAHPGGPY